MNAWITRTGNLRFINGNPCLELTGWTVRVGYEIEKSTGLYGCINGTREDAERLYRRVTNLGIYVAA